jgi:hypothetical protein
MRGEVREPAQWRRYIIDTDPDDMARKLTTVTFGSGSARHELLRFDRGTRAPAILISPGSSGTGRVFAELGYHLSARGASVYVMPKQGPFTLTQLMNRHDDALRALADAGHARIGVFAEGLGAYVAFYLALAGGPMHTSSARTGPRSSPSAHIATRSTPTAPAAGVGGSSRSRGCSRRSRRASRCRSAAISTSAR